MSGASGPHRGGPSWRGGQREILGLGGSPGYHQDPRSRGSSVRAAPTDERFVSDVVGRAGASVLAALVKGRPMEHFIPFRRTDVVSMCADELPAAERDSFVGFARMLTSLLHYRFQGRIEALKDA